MPVRFLAEWSVQRRFALHTAYAVCIAVLLGGVLVDVADGIADNEIFDHQLNHIAGVLAATVVNNSSMPDAANMQVQYQLDSTRPQRDGLLYQVWHADGTLLRHSQGMSASTPLVRFGQMGYATVDMQGDSYRTYAAPGPDGQTVIQVAERIDDHDFHLWLLLIYLASLALPLFLTWRASRILLLRSLNFFNTLAEGVAARDPHDASPVHMDEPPREIMPMLNSVNGLVQRAASVISLEQRFTSLAAHELRAPLASIRAQAQMARLAESEQEFQDAMELVMRGVDHSARVFDQLLDLTRMEGLVSERAKQFKPVDLQSVCRQVFSELQFQMQRKQIHLIDGSQAHEFDGVYFATYLIVRNLIANAVLYTPANGTVAVSITLQDGQLLLQVDDSGKGIAPEDRQRVFERYSRLHENSNEGIGLGLFIVQQAVHLHGGKVELLGSPYGGLRAQVCFPLHLKAAVAGTH
jgi:signal transduction histidine kinase